MIHELLFSSSNSPLNDEAVIQSLKRGAGSDELPINQLHGRLDYKMNRHRKDKKLQNRNE